METFLMAKVFCLFFLPDLQEETDLCLKFPSSNDEPLKRILLAAGKKLSFAYSSAL